MRFALPLILAVLAVPPLAAQSRTPATTAAAADPFVGTFHNEQDESITIEKQGSTYRGSIRANGASFPFTARKMGRSLIGTFDAEGESVLFQVGIQGDQLSFLMNGETTILHRGRAGTRPRTAAGDQAQVEAPRHATGQDAEIQRILLSSPWCHMRYSQTLGSTNTERGAFYRDGRLIVGTGHEMVSSGANGTAYGSSSGDIEYRWRVQDGDLWLSEQGAPFQPTGLRITRNSSGYPILNVDGKEYSQCN